MLMILAMLTMLIDHIGAVFFPNEEWIRLIGRIAFPLYAFGIVVGYRNTRNLKKYFIRLAALAIISQVPYVLLFETFRLNVIFLFLVALLSLYLVDHHDRKLAIPFVISLTILIDPFIEYGIYGIALVFMYRYFSGNGLLLGHFLLSAAFLFLMGDGFIIQFFAFVATFLIVFKDKLLSYPVKVNRQFYRAFYPAHLAILALVSVFV